MYAIINSTPAPGGGARRGSRGGKKVERRAFIVRYDLSGEKGEKTEEDGRKWQIGKVRGIGKRAVTVFTVR